ncbi:hypothetical protein ACQE98_00475 [Ornithinimicrobium sp. W1679]|uniref:hypothetical protein n=1 Tax=Ornithinimicrobium sp. W1679 TaxID=3418770 RepID=UPI003CF295A2
MDLSTRTQNALIAGLAALAVGSSAFAVWSVNRPHPSLNGDAGQVAASASTAEPDDSAVTSGPSGQGTDGVAVTSTDGATQTGDSAEPVTPSVKGAEPDDGATVQAWADAWADESDLLVIGDGYSNMPTQWVQLWGDEVGNDRPVTIHHWGEAADVTFNDPIVLSEEPGPELTIWSASRDGTSIADAAERVDRFVDQAGDVDAVLVSLGMDSEDEDVAASLDTLLAEVDAIDEDLPVLVAVAPPELYGPSVADELLAWAEENADRVAVVDLSTVTSDDPTAEEWALAFDQIISND